MEEAGEEPMATEDAGGRSFLRKDINHSPHLDRDRLIDSRTMLIVSENEWQYPLSSMSANEDLVDGEEVKAANACAGSNDASVNLVNLDDDNVMVEELTVRNYKGSNSMTIQHSCKGEKMSLGIDQRQWHHYLQIAGGSSDNVIRANDMLKETLNLGGEKAALTICSPTVQRSNSPKSLSGPGDISKTTSTKGDIVEMSKTSSHSSGEMCNQVYSTSGFHHFFSKNSLKGKGTLNTLHEPHVGSRVVTLTQMHEKKACQVDVGSNVSHGFGTRKKHLCKGTDTETCNASPCGDGGGPNVDIISHGGCLREWLASECQKVNKIERLFIFRQILELVAQAHLHGIALKELRPSYFFVMPSKKVRYDGSWSNPSDEMNVAVANQGSFNEEHVKRKRFLEGGSRSNGGILYKRYKLGGSEMKMNVGHPTFGASIGLEIGGDIGINSSLKGLSYGEDQSYDRGFEAENLSSNPNKSSSVPATFGAGNLSSNPNKSSSVPMTFGSLHMEERWYSSPEELNGGCCTIQSNIYSLGVLFFELFCHFESSEVHARAMSDLRHRILPPSFLSESTNEAGFCLWLLHPDPSSRPKPREILQSEMINEVRHLPSVNELSLAVDEEDSESELLLHFLFALKDQKQKQALKLVGDLGHLREDIKEVERRHSLKVEELGASHASVEYPQKDISSSQMNETRLMRNIRQLEHAYFSMKLQGALPVTDARNRLDKDVLKDDNKLFVHQNDAGGSYTSASTDRIGAFFEGVCKYARYNKFETRGILRNGDFLGGSANVICSLSFDRDEDYFAAAGVSKKIKIFEFHSLLNDMVDIHYPIIEMSSKSKLSCVCWNNYIKNYLASTDHDGVVQLWDANTGQGFIQYAEHQRRAWSVDFSHVDPTKLASGSDDCSVKLWSINEKNCLSSIGNAANVCCVQFSSHSTNLLAFGSADYKINCYDLRNTRIPWCTLAGHGKAVSYVKFIDPVTLISASTDNTLKLWDLNKTTSGGLSTNACSLTLRGHSNEKNFVGLSVFDGYIACGSESNEVFAYYRSLPMPITSYKFGSIDPISGQEGGDDSGLFVSSVCWRGKSNTVVAANSNGFIKILQLV